MRNYQPGYHEHWEDAYSAELHPTFEALQAHADEYWLRELGPLNWPVWVEYDADNEQEYDCGPTVSVGVFLPRHGHAAVHLAPTTPEQYQEVIQTLFRVWSLRADLGFPRYGGERRVERPGAEP